ncbi:MAG: cardiolipin synthase [bacterium]|nr:cardiolipin synthase [bacterium]
MKNTTRFTNPIREHVKGRVQSHFSGFLRAFVVGVLVLFQFGFIIALPFLFSQYTIYLYLALIILSVCLIFSIVNDQRSMSYKMAWVYIVLLLPISGHIMYALWGKANAKSKIDNMLLTKLRHGFTFAVQEEEVLKQYRLEYPTKYRMANYMREEGFPLFKNNQVTYFPMGEDAFNDIFIELENAKNFIMIDFFIVAEGAIWDHLHAILLDRIKAGVKVMFMYDDFGAMFRTNKEFEHQLIEEGFEVRIFNPVHKYLNKLYMNYRSHQKIVVIDGNIGYTGGFNIADEYANLVTRFGVWKDNGVKVVGDAVWGLTVTFLQMWEICTDGELIDYSPYKPTMKFEENQVYCQVISDGPANNPNNPIENIYMQMIQYATEYVYITTPYLIIEDDMREALILAAKSGIDVRIICPGIPDKKNVKCLTNFNYGALLRGGVKIYEYTPGFIHAKTIINESTGIVGTINMDYRSFYLHYENGIWMSNREVIEVIRKDFVKTLEECHEFTYDEWRNRPWVLKAYQNVISLFSTLM